MTYTDPETIPPIWQIGDVILDRYEVQQIFTSGGMGLVYRVHWQENISIVRRLTIPTLVRIGML